jgi:hypothetical protein
VVALAKELQVNPVVLNALRVQPLPEPYRAQQFHRPGLKQPGALTGLAVRPRPVLDHDGIHPGQRQQMGKEQASGAGPDYSDLSTRSDRHVTETP